MPKIRLKKDDQVVVRTGKDAGKRGRVLQVLPDKNRVVVEGVNVIKRHTRPNPQKNVKGGIIEREAAIHASNVAIADPDNSKPSRLGATRLADGRKVRVSRKSGAVVDK